MKSAYIIFSKELPEDNKTIKSLITHFCREHNLTCRIRRNSDCKTAKIDGKDYEVKLVEKQEELEPTYWMIYCSLRENPKTCRRVS